MADKAQLAVKNKLINELYDDVDTISEELVDGNYKEVVKTADSLSAKLKHLKANITNEEI